jgi:methylmalonic acid semialdehyde dehydrogenase
MPVDRASIKPVTNFVNNEHLVRSGGSWVDITDPATGDVVTQVMDSTAAELAEVVDAAQAAFAAWSGKTMKARAAIMMKLHYLINENAQELAELIVIENGKNIAEALADVAKGNETVEWACSLPQVAQGKMLEVSGGITCRDDRLPLGVVAAVVPCNFPLMVPMWTSPIALVMGNCVILKPSEQVPMTMRRVCDLFVQAGFPKGVFQTVNGTASVVSGLIDNPKIKAVTFVGSTKIAEVVATRAHKLHKRVLSLGGAKNHLVALPDAILEQTAVDSVVSAMGCCGQRCMAAANLVIVDPDNSSGPLVARIVQLAGALKAGQGKGELGPLINKASQDKVLRYITESKEKYGSEILLDGRDWAKKEKGHWVGATVIKIKDMKDPAMHEEIFGPVLCVITVKTVDEAIEIENANPYGNAACVYTRNGGYAEQLINRFRAGMLGVNVGIPVPREPFTFGGLYGTLSKFGDGDITGDGAMEFFSTRRKVTVRWGDSFSTNLQAKVAKTVTADGDKANFAGTM